MNESEKGKRRQFLKIGLFTALTSFLYAVPGISFGANQNKKGICKHADEGEVYQIRPNSFVTIKASKRKDGIETISLCTEEFPPGGKIPVHKHLYEDEMIFIHKGSGVLTLDNELISVEAGSMAIVPKYSWHGLENTGNESILMVFGYNPTGFEDFFRQVGTPKGQEFKQLIPEERIKIAEKMGMIFKK
ncbi:MAG TPA: cupin domain-containing protein [Mucilaginibacter sp.]|jgi:quercetin dioxygenase-like cupin family protein